MYDGDLRINNFSLWGDGKIVRLKEHQAIALLREAGASLSPPLSIRQIRTAIRHRDLQSLTGSSASRVVRANERFSDLCNGSESTTVNLSIVFLSHRGRFVKGWKLPRCDSSTNVQRLGMTGPSLACIECDRCISYVACLEDGFVPPVLVQIRPKGSAPSHAN